jgi:hypothetical protein
MRILSLIRTAIHLLFKVDLMPEDIYDIYISPSAVPSSIYGQNAMNGVVQIWTKKLFTD